MTARRNRSDAGQETRTLLIEVAERLFAERGYEAVTVADIRTAAGQRNASVVGYYFGSKENLLRAILEHRLPAVNARREAMMRENLGEGDANARDALWCLVQPLADTLHGNNHYVALLDRLVETDLLGNAFHAADPAGSASAFAIDDVLYAAIGHVPDSVRRQRIMMVYDSMLRTLARYDRAGTKPGRAELTGLVDAWEGLLRAPIRDRNTTYPSNASRPTRGL
ncbi:TetR/AcrR family transcriptional regulator [Rhodococcus sp. CH91]|uniref:TetR/AcrR family transcriptional regulator n=1 Tax=Rhodococcus sp. CH91 TaxID=2910256 RepID=UPI001F4A2D09|nr:TetR/AcrR family transcriptional regulator [Rhodococcus sp. CH91]